MEFPHEIFLGSDNSGAGHACKNDVAVGKQCGIIKLLDGPGKGAHRFRIFPNKFAVPDEEHGLSFGMAHIPLSYIQKWVLT